MNAPKVRVAVVSATGSGSKRTIPALADSELCTVSAIHGRDRERLAEVASAFGISRTYTAIEELIGDGQFDMIYVASPPFLHLEQMSVCVGAGVPIMVEKPLAHSLAAGREIAALVADSGVAVAVAHHLRHQQAFGVVAETVSSGQLGWPMRANFEWNFKLDRDRRNSVWKTRPELNGLTCMSDAGVHCLDLAQGVFGELKLEGAVGSEPARPGGVVEMVEALLSHSGGLLRVGASRLFGPYGNDLEISGPQGRLVIEGFFGEQASTQGVLITGSRTQVVKFDGTNPYRQEVEDFASTALSSHSNRVAEPVSIGRAIDTLAIIDRLESRLCG